MKDNNHFQEKCKFSIHPCNFEVKISEVIPFHVCAYKALILDLQVINHCKIKSFIKIKSKPRYGDLYLLRPSTLVYKSTKKFSGFDLFQVLIKDEYDEKRIENIFIHVIS